MTAPLPCVCFLTGTLNEFAGAERMTAVIASALAERGYRVLVLSLWDEASVFPLHPDVRHHALFAARPSFKREYLATVRGIRRFVREHQVDALIEVDTMLTLFTLPATTGMEVRRIAWEHCHFEEDLGSKARHVARRLAALTNEAIVVLTTRDRVRWESVFFQRAKLVTIGNPLPFPLPTMAAPRDTATVLAVGRLVPAKGFDVLLDAWARAHMRHPSWHLRIVGEGEERAALEAKVKRLGLHACVSLPGVLTDMETVYRDSTIFCLSSRYEGFGLALIEAMAFGLAVVSTACETGPRELIRDQENGLLAPVNDPDALARALDHLMSDATLRDTLGAQARDDARAADPGYAAGLWEQLLR